MAKKPKKILFIVKNVKSTGTPAHYLRAFFYISEKGGLLFTPIQLKHTLPKTIYKFPKNTKLSYIPRQSFNRGNKTIEDSYPQLKKLFTGKGSKNSRIAKDYEWSVKELMISAKDYGELVWIGTHYEVTSQLQNEYSLKQYELSEKLVHFAVYCKEKTKGFEKHVGGSNVAFKPHGRPLSGDFLIDYTIDRFARHPPYPVQGKKKKK